MKRAGFFVILALGLAVSLPTLVAAQHRYLGETGARVLQCARFYSSVQAQLLCVRGDELRAGQFDRLGMLDDLSSGRLVRQTGGVFGYDGGDGYFYPTDRAGRPTGTREKIITGGAIGATLGAGIGAMVGRGGTGALLGAGTGAIFGAVVGRQADKRAKWEVLDATAAAETAAAVAEIKKKNAEDKQRLEAETASREQKLLRNRFDASVRVFLRTPDGQIEELTLDPGQTLKINPLRGTQLVLAEVETEDGKWIRLEFGSGKVRLAFNTGWEFFNPATGS